MATQIAPLAKGLYEEGVGTHSPSVSQRTCVVRWSDFQKTLNGPLTPNNSMDSFIKKGYTGRARIYMGRYSPPFVLNMGKVTMEDAYDKITSDCPMWWLAEVQAAQRDFLTKFAAAYDGKISAIFIANGGTTYAEPFIRGIASPVSRKNLLAAGYTPEKDQETYVAGYNMCKVFKITRIAQAFNPWQYVNADGNGRSDINFTIQMMDKLAAMFPRRAIWQNNSIRTPPLKTYATMYTHMAEAHKTKGRPIGFQCATAPRIGSWEQTLQWAVDQGAYSVELSPGFMNGLTAAQLARFDKALRAA